MKPIDTYFVVRLGYEGYGQEITLINQSELKKFLRLYRRNVFMPLRKILQFKKGLWYELDKELLLKHLK